MADNPFESPASLEEHKETTDTGILAWTIFIVANLPFLLVVPILLLMYGPYKKMNSIIPTALSCVIGLMWITGSHLPACIQGVIADYFSEYDELHSGNQYHTFSQQCLE